MKANVDKETCIGCGLCESTCPEIFRIDTDGKSSVIVDEIPQELENAAINAQEECPVGAIYIN